MTKVHLIRLYVARLRYSLLRVGNCMDLIVKVNN